MWDFAWILGTLLACAFGVIWQTLLALIILIIGLFWFYH